MQGIFRGALCALIVAAAGCAGPADKPAAVSGIERANFDTTVRPQDDFYQHVNGTWLKTTQIPADKPVYGAFSKLRDDSEARLREIIEAAAAKPGKAEGTDEQKVGDLYNSFMDEAQAEALGLKPIQAELDRVKALKSKSEIAALMAHFSRIGVKTPIGGYVNQDDKDPTQYIVYLLQSGLGMPDRDYYLLDDARFKALRAQYVAHVTKMLELSGDANAAANAKSIMALETALAKKHWTRVESRDSEKTYNKYPVTKLRTLAPALDWDSYLRGSGVTSPAVIVAQPSAFTGFSELLASRSLPVWRTYFRWRVIDSYAPYLSKAFVDQDFAFYGKTLRGTEENRPRWKRAVAAVENSLGESLGKIYVARHFPPEAKARMETLVANLIKAYEQSIRELDWMSETTKAEALQKLAKFTPKIGYPNKWRDYTALAVRPDDLVGNLMRSNAFEHDFHIAKLGKPIDREEWFMTPQTVNAYYNPNMNEIVFPAAILQPPFFNLAADDAVNYGGIGAVIGHEIGHGFDDQGSKYDGDGNLVSWWTEEDRKRFEERTKALIAQYDTYEALPGEHVNGAFTIGENIGDLGGLSIAYKAYKMSHPDAPVIDGLTGDQRVFMGWAQVWRRNYTEANLLQRLKSDPHSPSEFRCNGIVRNIPEWYTAFGVTEDDALYLAPEQRVKIW